MIILNGMQWLLNGKKEEWGACIVVNIVMILRHFMQHAP